MATLVLEDLNLVTLAQLLKRVNGETKISRLRAVIGDREIFTQSQADLLKKIPAAHADTKALKFEVVSPMDNLLQVTIQKRAGRVFFGLEHGLDLSLLNGIEASCAKKLLSVVEEWVTRYIPS